jgi:hypothetical protein
MRTDRWNEANDVMIFELESGEISNGPAFCPKECGGREGSQLAIDLHQVADIECGLVHSQISQSDWIVVISHSQRVRESDCMTTLNPSR